MSRIGKLPIPIPAGVTVDIQPGFVKVKGPKGELSRSFNPDITVRIDDNKLFVERPTDQRQHRALHGLTRALLNNMVIGVSDGFKRVLDIIGVGYRAEVKGEKLMLSLGYSHPIEVEALEGITFESGMDNATRMPFVVVNGINKENVGQQAAQIRSLRSPEPYKGKGIRYRGEVIRRKAGKSGKAGGKGKK